MLRCMCHRLLFLTLLSSLTGAAWLGAVSPPCMPCAGVRVEDPLAVLPALAAEPALTEDARLYVSWEVPVDVAASPAAARALEPTGVTPWMRLIFRSPAPITSQAQRLKGELESAAELARGVGPRTHFQIVWQPESGEADAVQYGFLLKRAAVAVTGAQPQARIITQALAADPTYLEALYGEGVAAYVDGVAFAPAEAAALASTLAKLTELDPGRPAVLDGLPFPANPFESLAESARAAASGFALVLFAGAPAEPAALAPLKVLANEMKGDLSLDPTSTPTGAGEAWTFVRGEDLSLRTIVRLPSSPPRIALRFPDPQLVRPARVDLTNGKIVQLAAVERNEQLTAVGISTGGGQSVALVHLDRTKAEEVKGVAEKVTVASERDMPVEEILRRLQAVEDAQARRLHHFQAINSTSLRFQAAQGLQSVEATFEGELFVRQGQPFDWAWQTFYLNGVKWRGKSIPEIPLVQPERAAAVPLEIALTKDYTYRLRGTDTIDGRNCWVVDFEPLGAVAPGHTLYRGSVWVDRELYVRVRTRTLQLGLVGDILSNEETFHYTPIDEAGRPAAWSLESYFMPLETTGQQILSVVNTATVVEKATHLTKVVVNGPDFDQRRDQVMASPSTMVRDTPQGMRYLVKEPTTGERRVKPDFDQDRLFAIAGVFWERSLDYPLPLLGVNYFSLNFRGHKRQLNAFFGGALGIVNYADPRFLGSKFDLGFDAFALAVAFGDKAFANGKEDPGQEIKSRTARFTLNLGHPLGSFGKLELSYRLQSNRYQHADDTAADFALPSNHLEHRLGAELKFSRSGYRVSVEGAYHRRSQWDAWGFAGNPDYDPDKRDYLTWNGALSKNWYFSKFRKLGAEIDYLSGSDLDRFSKYQFGSFGGSRVHGYSSDRIRASEVWGSHLSYGFELGQLLRLDAVGDVAWATDEATGLDRELLGGVGLSGSFMGPWETLVNLDVGTPVAGPDHGVTLYLVFLKLFK